MGQHGGRRAARSTAHIPAVDAYGTARFPGGGEGRVRLVEYAPNKFAAFSADNPTEPATFEASDYSVKGRVLTVTLANEGSELRFQKAGCSCETPQVLRAGRNALLRAAGLEPVPEPPPDTLAQQILSGEIPGTVPGS